MGNIIEFAKAHPIPIGIGVVLFIILLSRGSSSSSSTPGAADALKAQTVASNTSVQLANINAGTSVALGAQSVENSKTGAAAAAARASSAISALSLFVGADSQRALSDKANTLAITQASFANSANTLALNNKKDVDMATIGAGVSTHMADLSTSITLAKNDSNSKLAQIGATTSGNLQLLAQAGLNALQLQTVTDSGKLTLQTQSGQTAQQMQAAQLNSSEKITSMTFSERMAELLASITGSNTQLGMNLSAQKDSQAVLLASNAVSLPQLLQSQQYMATINGGIATQLAQIQGANQLNVVKANNQAANTAANASAGSSWASTAISVIAALFA